MDHVSDGPSSAARWIQRNRRSAEVIGLNGLSPALP